jgi:hypothetical protein
VVNKAGEGGLASLFGKRLKLPVRAFPDRFVDLLFAWK